VAGIVSAERGHQRGVGFPGRGRESFRKGRAARHGAKCRCVLPPCGAVVSGAQAPSPALSTVHSAAPPPLVPLPCLCGHSGLVCACACGIALCTVGAEEAALHESLQGRLEESSEASLQRTVAEGDASAGPWAVAGANGHCSWDEQEGGRRRRARIRVGQGWKV